MQTIYIVLIKFKQIITKEAIIFNIPAISVNKKPCTNSFLPAFHLKNNCTWDAPSYFLFYVQNKNQVILFYQ
jgi:hypothetical protein